MVFKIFHRLKKSERGAAIIEFAIITPILIAMVIGIIEFGWIYSGYITLTGAAREGARLAARGESVGIIDTRTRNHAITFTENQGGTIDSVSLSAGYRNSIPQGGSISVTVSGKIPLLFKFLGGNGSIIPFPLITDPFPLSAKATMRREY